MIDSARRETIATDEEVRQEAHRWRVRLSGGDVSSADRERFEVWLKEDGRHADAYDRAVTVWAALGSLRPDQVDKRFRLNAIKPRDREGRRRLRMPPPNRLGTAAALLAASLLLVVILPMSAPDGPEQAVEVTVAWHQTRVGETRDVIFDDGTAAVLGPDTALQVHFSAQSRRVVLEGGAVLLDVVHDPARPFVVEAADLDATVLGTRFDVRSNGGVVRVGVAEGEVRVSYPLIFGRARGGMKRRESLRAGQQIVARREGGLGDPVQIRPEAIGAWREGRLVYFGGTLNELAADLMRYSAAPITLEGGGADLGALKVTGSFNAADLDGILATLPDILPVSVEQNADSGAVIRAASAPGPRQE